MNNIKMKKIFIQIKGAGFTFLLDSRLKYSLVNPTLLNLFKEGYPPTEEEYQANMKAVEEFMRQNPTTFILPNHLKLYLFKDVYKEVGNKVVRCNDNKLRRCKAVKLNFEYEGQSYSELFYIDKELTVAAILGCNFHV